MVTPNTSAAERSTTRSRASGENLQSAGSEASLSLSEAASRLSRARHEPRQESSDGPTAPQEEAAPLAEANEQLLPGDSPHDQAGELEEGVVDEGSDEVLDAEAGEDPDAQPAEEAAALLEFGEDDDQKFSFDGEELSVGEFRESRMRKDDYTRKTQELAQQRSESETLTKQYAARLGQLDQEMRRELAQFDGVDWMALSQQNPQQYQATRAQYDAATMRHRQVQQQTEQMFGQLEDMQGRQKVAAGKAAVGVLKREIKGWNNARYHEILEYAESTGFDPKAIRDCTDPHIIIALNKAKAFDAAQKVATKKVVKPSAKRNLRANAATRHQPQQQRQDNDAVVVADEKLSKSGRVEDAMAVMKARRERQRNAR